MFYKKCYLDYYLNIGVLRWIYFQGLFLHLDNALNYSATKQKVISQNIANVDTPNYKAKDVSF